MDLTLFRKLPIIGILRGVEEEQISPLVEAVVSGGLGVIEITMNTDNAPKLIKKMVQDSSGRLLVGAGTVLSLDDMHKALEAGAAFIVMPVLVAEVVEYCRKNSIPVFPGALTPQEIYNAWQAGATMVKVFPSKLVGHTYFKEIKGPFKNIELLACGGVNAGNIAEFFRSGASAAAFGGSIFNGEWLKNAEYSKVRDSVKNIVDSYKAYIESIV